MQKKMNRDADRDLTNTCVSIMRWSEPEDLEACYQAFQQWRIQHMCQALQLLCTCLSRASLVLSAIKICKCTHQPSLAMAVLSGAVPIKPVAQGVSHPISIEDEEEDVDFCGDEDEPCPVDGPCASRLSQ